MHIQKNIVSMVTSARGKIVVQVSSVILYEHHSYVYFMLCSYVKNFMSPNVHKGAQVHKGGNLKRGEIHGNGSRVGAKGGVKGGVREIFFKNMISSVGV